MANTFGERLRSLRTGKGLSQLDVARAIDVNPGLVSQWENDKCILRDRHKAAKLAALLDCSFPYLFYDIEMKTEEQKEEPKPAGTQNPEAKPVVTPQTDAVVYKAEDGRRLDALNLCIRHLRDLNISKDEKIMVHKALSYYRGTAERIVLFGE